MDYWVDAVTIPNKVALYKDFSTQQQQQWSMCGECLAITCARPLSMPNCARSLPHKKNNNIKTRGRFRVL